MSKYIDADKIICHLKDEMECFADNMYEADNIRQVEYGTYLGLLSAKCFVETAETADVQEVVRCKDCKYFDTKDLLCERCGDIDEPCGACHYHGGCTNYDGYCHRGERRKDG